MIHGAIFDADGTLLNSMGMWDTVGERYLISLGVSPDPDLRKMLFSMSLAECAEYLREHYHLPKTCQEIEDGVNETIRQFYEQEVEAKPGAVEFLTQLRHKGVPLMVATATDRSLILKGLERTNILPLLDGVCTCGELGVSKRTPYIYDHVREKMGSVPEETWVFEDAVHAAQTAYHAHYRVAGIDDPYSDSEALRQVSHLYLTDWTDFEGFYRKAQAM